MIEESRLQLARLLEVELMLEFDPDMDDGLDDEQPLELFFNTCRDTLLLHIMSWIIFCLDESLVNFSYLHVLGYKVNGNIVLRSPRNDHICIFLCRETYSSEAGFTRVV